jgi:hypothetical protein
LKTAPSFSIFLKVASISGKLSAMAEYQYQNKLCMLVFYQLNGKSVVFLPKSAKKLNQNIRHPVPARSHVKGKTIDFYCLALQLIHFFRKHEHHDHSWQNKMTLLVEKPEPIIVILSSFV